MALSLALLERHAEAGHRWAWGELATLYLRGIGVKQNFREGKLLLLIAARTADRKAGMRLAAYYRLGSNGFERKEESATLLARPNGSSALIRCFRYLWRRLRTPARDIRATLSTLAGNSRLAVALSKGSGPSRPVAPPAWANSRCRDRLWEAGIRIPSN